MSLYIHAPNVHQGGGRTLLHALLLNISTDCFCILDERMPVVGMLPPMQIKLVKPTILQRLKTELWLFRQLKPTDKVLCFGNLPPLIESRANVSVFLQNRYLFGGHDFSSFSFGVRLRLRLERWWFRACMKPSYQIIVQSQSMQRELHKSLGFNSIVLPFIEKPAGLPGVQANNVALKELDFVYVSSAEPHKNHINLIAAWVLLAEQGLRPSLALTLSESADCPIQQMIEGAKRTHALNIQNFGTLPYAEIQSLYRKSKALIFPSKLESFGLPLLEAKQKGMAILAPELDYVRDVVEPDQTFDPNSPTSIARAVARYLAVEPVKTEPVDAATFLARIQRQGDA